MSTYQSHARLRWALENITLSHNTMVRVFIIKHECVISTAVATVLPVSTGYHVHRLLPKHECIVYDIGRGGASYLCPASCCSHNTNAFALIRYANYRL